MGLFSSKYVTQVGTSVSRVIEDDTIPQSVKTGTIKSILNSGNLTDYVMEELVASIGVRAERMYAYAEDSYVHGLPSGEVYSSTQGRQQVEAVIEAIEGQQVLIEYSRFGPPNTLHIGWMRLVEQYGYNQGTNELGVLSVQKGFPVYLKDMVVVVPNNLANSFEAGSLDQWGTAASAGYTPERLASVGNLIDLAGPSPIFKSTTATVLQLQVTYVWEKPGVNVSTAPTVEQESLTIIPSGFDDEADYFHAKYSFNGQTKYWMYRYNSGTYPTLDAVFVSGPVVSGEYFPFAYFRFNKQSVISNTTSPAYLTSKKMVKYLGMDYDVMANAIDENPDIADVEQAMLIMAVPAFSTDPIEARYLFEYFDTLHAAMGGTVSSGLANISRLLSGDSEPKNTIVIKDAQFKMALTNDGIYKKITAGSIGNVGTHNNSYTVETVQTPFVDPDTGNTSFVASTIKTHFYRRQISVGLYEEIAVRNLKLTYFVFENYTTIGDEIDDILLIPIDRTVSQNYSIGDREVLYARSLHFVFNSVVVTKVKWYQTGVFKVLLLIVAIAMAIYDGGATIGAYLSLTGTAAIVATVVIQLVVGQLLAVAFKLFVKVFGADVATAFAILAIVYGGYQILQAGGVAGAPWAQALLELSSGLQQAALASRFEDLLGEAAAFELFVEEQTTLLETSKELLENSTLLSPFVIFGESPEDFYNRTIHSGNIGVLGITAISSYVDIALTLPKLNDTVGEETYERT